MPAPSGFVAHVLDLLGPWGGVSARRMFSGYGLHRRGLMFALVAADTLYLKTGERNRPDFRAAGTRPFTFRRQGKAVETSYWQVPSELLDDGEELIRWAERSFQAAQAARARPRVKRSRSAAG